MRTLFALLLAGLYGPAVANVTVTVRLAAPDALEAAYELPPACGKLAFLEEGQGRRPHPRALASAGRLR